MAKYPEIEEICKQIMQNGDKNKVKSPDYAEFVDFLSTTFEPIKEKNGKGSARRPRELLEAKSMSKRQVVYAEVLDRLCNILEVSEQDRSIFRSCFLKIENVLSVFNSELICTPLSEREGRAIFFRLIALPQFKEFLRFWGGKKFFLVAAEMWRYIDISEDKNFDSGEFLMFFRSDVLAVVQDIPASSFKISVGKMDSRSFPKMTSIVNILDELRDEILPVISSCKVDVEEIIYQIRCKFLAAKLVFKLLKINHSFVGDFKVEVSPGFEVAHQLFCNNYLCSEEVRGDGFDVKAGKVFNLAGDENLKYIIFNFKRAAGHIDYDDVPNAVANNPLLLCNYQDNALLPWYVYHKLLFDLNRDRIDDFYLKHFESAFLGTAKKYQYGLVAVQISSILIACKIKMCRFVPPQSLEPLAMVMMRSAIVSGDISLRCLNPFGLDEVKSDYTSDLNVARAISVFNSLVRSNEIQAGICNPLDGVDRLLQHIFDQVDLGREVDGKVLERNKSVKGFDVSLYDAVKGINRLLHLFGLSEKEDLKLKGMRVVCSCAGEAINRYLSLDVGEKIKILSIIDFEQCATDLNNKDVVHDQNKVMN